MTRGVRRGPGPVARRLQEGCQVQLQHRVMQRPSVDRAQGGELRRVVVATEELVPVGYRLRQHPVAGVGSGDQPRPQHRELESLPEHSGVFSFVSRRVVTVHHGLCTPRVPTEERGLDEESRVLHIQGLRRARRERRGTERGALHVLWRQGLPGAHWHVSGAITGSAAGRQGCVQHVEVAPVVEWRAWVRGLPVLGERVARRGLHPGAKGVPPVKAGSHLRAQHCHVNPALVGAQQPVPSPT